MKFLIAIFLSLFVVTSSLAFEFRDKTYPDSIIPVPEGYTVYQKERCTQHRFISGTAIEAFDKWWQWLIDNNSSLYKVLTINYFSEDGDKLDVGLYNSDEDLYGVHKWSSYELCYTFYKRDDKLS